MKRCTPKGNKKKKATNKRPKTLGPLVRAPAAATRLVIPRVTIISLRSANHSDQWVEVILDPSTISAPSTTILAS